MIDSSANMQCRRRWKNFQDAELKKTGVWTPAVRFASPNTRISLLAWTVQATVLHAPQGAVFLCVNAGRCFVDTRPQ